MAQQSSHAVPHPPERTRLELFLLTAVITIAPAMQGLDSTITNVSLPHIQGSMSASLDQVTWVLTAYVVAAAISIPLTTFLTMRFGRRRLLLTALCVFTAASMLCGASQSLEQIVVFRFLQGSAGAFLLPSSQAVLLNIYPREKHGFALAMWSMGATVAPMLGPSVGGYLTEYYSWRWVFYINLPVGILTIIGVTFLLGEGKRDLGAKFDARGFMLIATAIGALQMMLDRGTTLDWFSSMEIVIEATLAGLALYLFVVHMLTTPRPFLSRELFKNVNFIIGMSVGFIVIIVAFSSSALMPTMLQSLLGYPVLTTGFMLLPRGLGAILAMPAANVLARKVDHRFVIFAGVMIAGLALWHMSRFNLDVGQTEVMANGLLQGFGSGLAFMRLTTLTFATLESRFFTEASSMFGLVRSLGSSVGVSIIATLIARLTQVNHSNIVEYITPYSRGAQFAASAAGSQSVQSAVGLDGEINRQATMIAYLDVFQLMAGVVIASAFLLLLVRVPKKATPPAIEQVVVEV